MHNRLRVLKGATALLYFGPLLAGLGGFGWGVIPVFAAIFMLWLFILRPLQWPRTLADWARPEALIALLTQGLMQVLLVAVSFGIGRGIGGVLDVVPPFPLMLPIAISFLSIPLARLIFDPWATGEPTDLLDEALAQAVPQDQTDTKARIAAANRMVTELGRLPSDTPDTVLAAHLAAMTTQVSPEILRVALMDPIYDGEASALHLRAAVVHATTPEVADHLIGTTYAMAVFRELKDPEHLRLFASRCADLVTQNPGRTPDCPETGVVLAMADHAPRARDALVALAATLAAAQGLSPSQVVDRQG